MSRNLNLLQNSSTPTYQFNNNSLDPNRPTLQSLRDNFLPATTIAPQYTLAQPCRLELEKWLNPTIDQFLEMGKGMPPLLDWVWDIGDHFLINIKFNNFFARSEYAFLGAKWNWQDQFGNNFTVDKIFENYGRRHIPLMKIKVPPFNESHQTEHTIPVSLWASNVNVPENRTIHPWTYDLCPFRKCDCIEVDDD